MNVKNNKSARRTRKALWDAYAELSKTRDIRDISANDLVKKCGISRATYYTHYHDVFELQDAVAADFMERLSEAVAPLPVPIKNVEERKAAVHERLVSLFKFFRANSRWSLLLLGSAGGLSFREQLGTLVLERCVEPLEDELGDASEKGASYHIFAVCGLMGLLQSWVERGRRGHAEDMATIALDLLVSSGSYSR